MQHTLDSMDFEGLFPRKARMSVVAGGDDTAFVTKAQLDARLKEEAEAYNTKLQIVVDEYNRIAAHLQMLDEAFASIVTRVRRLEQIVRSTDVAFGNQPAE